MPNPTLNKRSCPKCRRNLEVVLQEGVEVDTCRSCKGVWVDHVEEKDLLQMKPAGT